EDREGPVGPNRDVRDLRQTADVRDGEERVRVAARSLNFEVRQKQRCRRGHADVARVVVVRRGWSGSSAANTERVRRIGLRLLWSPHALTDRSARQAEGGHEGQD